MDDRLKDHMAEIGTRYLRRTVGELGRLEQLLAGIEVDPTSVKDLEQLAHKIYGSGAMFGVPHCISFPLKPGGTSNRDFAGSVRLMFVSL